MNATALVRTRKFIGCHAFEYGGDELMKAEALAECDHIEADLATLTRVAEAARGFIASIAKYNDPANERCWLENWQAACAARDRLDDVLGEQVSTHEEEPPTAPLLPSETPPPVAE